MKEIIKTGWVYMYRTWMSVWWTTALITSYSYYPKVFEEIDASTQDWKMYVFMPSYFIIVCLCLHFLHRIVGSSVLSYLFSGFFLAVTFFYSLTYMDEPIFVRVGMSVYGLAFGLFHYFLTSLIYRKRFVVSP